MFIQRDGFRRQRADGRLRSPTDLGPGKVRRKSTATVRTITPQIWMTRVQLERFGTFWDVDTKGGALPFWFPEPGRHGFPMRSDDGGVLLAADGSPLLISAWVLVMFSPDAEPPQDTTTADDLWPVSLSLDIMP
ncbi:hypothetical protein SAMN02745157_1471 [Kaistia soli DSM 19436]|uniref:Uncharacterized protein n=1 Tax=Kaistia soli DSM 19436 TaxID=1122133 RepID=A0A1M4YB72_9HYPH|nr:hypothetical protein [Kaistia soli]SHF02838.1 hypothetical protein SAMN02745157_1471 [Kaistia soli DSM 19436]